MSPTPDIDDYEDDSAECRHGLTFLLGYDEDGPYVDMCIDVSAVIGQTYAGMLAAEKLTGIKNRDAYNIAAALKVMDLRSRHMHGSVDPGPYLIRTESPMTREELEIFLRSCEPSRRKALLKQARL
jgi:hypothetical protein